MGTRLDAQTDQQNIEPQDALLWRGHTVSLSNDGAWYALSYFLSSDDKLEDADVSGDDEFSEWEEASADEPPMSSEELTSSEEEEDEDKQKDMELYGEDSPTDVLLIRQANGSKEYRIERGERALFSQDSQWVAYVIPEEEEAMEESFGEESFMEGGDMEKFRSRNAESSHGDHRIGSPQYGQEVRLGNIKHECHGIFFGFRKIRTFLRSKRSQDCCCLIWLI